jgi:hypothetical protein
MCKEMLVITVNSSVDPKRRIGKNWRAEEEKRHKGSLTLNIDLHHNIDLYHNIDLQALSRATGSRR